MKIYISLPISGHDLRQVRQRADEAKAWVRRKGHDCITPFDVCPGPLPYAEAMGRDIAALLKCDGIFLLAGWSDSRGCQLEWEAAKVYNKHIFHHITEIKPINTRV